MVRNEGCESLSAEKTTSLGGKRARLPLHSHRSALDKKELIVSSHSPFACLGLSQMDSRLVTRRRSAEESPVIWFTYSGCMDHSSYL